ncbi:phosphatase PAP2 family protein [Streptomyces sp. NRRL B-1347]|uniref:phosphatase PAP2 family protein n=1 Tax=Streptomyces sp. NRRL B-1347 TaxID=1476877 RepID=UPI00068F3380|nr:phosphatase PAP2 family protein [Streptomyces sp. NRRL B-1347]
MDPRIELDAVGGARDAFGERVRKRLRCATAAAVLLLAAVYAAFVLTGTGQRWENAALAGRHLDESLAAAHDASRLLDHITVSSLAAAVLVLAAIGLLRRRYALTAAAVGTVCGSLLAAEILKRYVLPRPDLVDAPDGLTHNSFPSGHTTIAMSVMFGLILVVPYRLRGLAAGICYLWAAFVGAYTVAAGWHRPSDMLGADLLVLAVVCGLTAALARTGRVRRAGGRRFPLRALLVVLPLTFFALTGLVTGTILLLDSMFRLDARDPAVPRLAYESGHALAAGAGAAVTLLLLALLRHVDLDGPGPRRSRGRVL